MEFNPESRHKRTACDCNKIDIDGLYMYYLEVKDIYSLLNKRLLELEIRMNTLQRLIDENK